MLRGLILPCAALLAACGTAHLRADAGSSSSDARVMPVDAHAPSTDAGAPVEPTGCAVTERLDVVLPEHPVLLEVSVDGAALPSFDEDAHAELHFVAEGSPPYPQLGVHVPLFDGGGPRHRQVVNLPPGIWDVWFEGTAREPYRHGGVLPIVDGVVARGLVIEAGTARQDIDIDTVFMTLVPTLGGEPLPDPSGGLLYLGGHVWPLAMADGEPVDSIRGRVLRGEYDIAIQSSLEDGGPFPLSTTLGSVVVEDESRIVFDIPAARVAVTLTTNGAPIEAGTHRLWLEREGRHVTPILDDGHADLMLVPGRYTVAYTGTAALSGMRQVIDELEVTGDTSVTIDLPRVRSHISIRVVGASRAPSCEAPATLSVGVREIELPRPNAVVELDAWVVSGELPLIFTGPSGRCSAFDAGWPSGSSEVGTVEVSELEPDIDIRLERALLTFVPTLDGRPPPPIAIEVPSDSEPPRITLENLDEELYAVFRLPLYPRYTLDAGTPNRTLEAWVFAGDYRVVFTPGSEEYSREWPLFAAELRPLNVRGDQRVEIDVPRRAARISVTSMTGGLRSYAEQPWIYGPPGLAAFALGEEPDSVIRFDPTTTSRHGLWRSDDATGETRAVAPRPPGDVWLVPGTYGLRFDWASFWWPSHLQAQSGLPPLQTPLGCWRVR